MSQIYREMNKTGKRIWWAATVMVVVGLVGSILTNNTIFPVAMSLGLYNWAMAAYDKRCNILNDSKGNPLPTTPKK